MNNQKDYYQVLGVAPSATPAEIRRAYRRLAVLYHPDRDHSPQATVHMQAINEAYDVLSDQLKRMKYDLGRGHSGSAATASPAQPGAKPTELQQIYAEEVASPFVIHPLVSMTLCFMLLENLVPWILSLFHADFSSSSDFPLQYVLVAAAGALLVGILTWVWNEWTTGKIESSCPRCKRPWAAIKLSERWLSKSKKTEYWGNRPREITYERFKMHYKCQYCSYEWYFVKSVQESSRFDL